MIDQLRFDQQFLSVLSLIASCLTLIGMVLRPLMASRSIAYNGTMQAGSLVSDVRHN